MAEYPNELTEGLRRILGIPNLQAGPWAYAFRDAGAEIKPKSEDEQAFILHKMIGLYLAHGEEGWWPAFADEVNAAIDIGKPVRAARKAEREAREKARG